MKRTLWFCENLSDASSEAKQIDIAQAGIDANLISSRLENGNHAPTLDIDVPCQLLESSTPGHHHLYIDKELTWEQYRVLLSVLADVGIVEPGYYGASVRQGHTLLRRPGVTK